MYRASRRESCYAFRESAESLHNDVLLWPQINSHFLERHTHLSMPRVPCYVITLRHAFIHLLEHLQGDRKKWRSKNALHPSKRKKLRINPRILVTIIIINPSPALLFSDTLACEQVRIYSFPKACIPRLKHRDSILLHASIKNLDVFRNLFGIIINTAT